MNSISPYQFSIILPVRNGGSYIRECIQSILAQTIGNFNLIILDSGSTDGTIEWLNTLKDPRIILHLSTKPLSITENWARIKSIPRKEWMTIIGHDDIFHPNYLETITSLITQYPEASLYQTHFTIIDAVGKFLRSCKPMEEIQKAEGLLNKILSNEINVFGTGFMMRSKDYDAVGGIPLFPNLLSADYVLWLKLTSFSFKATSINNCFSYRMNQSTTATSSIEVYMAALKLFVDYLIKEKDHLSSNEDRNEYARRILSFYCKRISRRLIAAKLDNRNHLTVNRFLSETNVYAEQFFSSGYRFNPSSLFELKLAKIIDHNFFARKIFLLLKKVHPNPLIK